MTTFDDLRDLVDAPSENLAVEYKCSLDFLDKVSRAKFARHAAALANYGGGYIVAGFKNDMSLESKTEFSEVNHDTVASVVKHFLSPSLHCEVRVVVASGGTKHTVVCVPSHATVPICASRDGPQDQKGNPQGIKAGTYYIRKPGPESAPIIDPSEWAPVIRRCALAERASILGAIEAALKGEQSGDPVEPRLRHWHGALAGEYRARIETEGRIDDLGNGYIQFSFAVHHSGGEIDFDELSKIVNQCNADADAVTKMHWGPFVALHKDVYMPRYRTSLDVEKGERDFLEASLLDESIESITRPTIWRVSNGGIASLIKGWWEDNPRFGAPPRSAVSPDYLAQDIVGLVVFARAFARSFGTATAVTFLFEWNGLKGRRPHDPSGRWHMTGDHSMEDRRVSTRTIPVAELEYGWEGPCATLAGPIARAIGIGHVLNKEWFASMKSFWARRP
ncbi:MAG: helix-turn-helix domain-containing protein [Roseiarcus sp.]